MYLIQHYVIKFVNDLQQVGSILQVLQFPPPIKTYPHDITDILLKVALNTITLTPSVSNVYQLEENPNLPHIEIIITLQGCLEDGK